MGVRHPAGETVTVTRAGAPTGGEDEQGNPIIGPDILFDIADVAIAPETSTETAENPGIRVVVGYTLYCPYSAPALLPEDRLTVRGVEGWQVVGDTTALGWRSPFDGIGRGVVVTVKRAA